MEISPSFVQPSPKSLLRCCLMGETCFLFLSLRGPPAPTAYPSQQPQQWLGGQPEPQPAPAPLRPASDPQPSQSRGAGPLRPFQLPASHRAACKSLPESLGVSPFHSVTWSFTRSGWHSRPLGFYSCKEVLGWKQGDNALNILKHFLWSHQVNTVFFLSHCTLPVSFTSSFTLLYTRGISPQNHSTNIYH